MPELPEVETVKRTLNQLILGKTIETVDVRWPNIIKKPRDPAEFAARLTGETIQKIRRRGKFLLFCMDSLVMVSHLRMEGRYSLVSKDTVADKYTHVIFYFTDGTALFYRDVRKFGTMHLFNKGEEQIHPPLAQLGPEPLSQAFTVDCLADACRRTTRAVKTTLLDQHAVVGLGNIYVDEALFRAGIHPLTPASALTDTEFEALHQSIIDTLSAAVRLGGSTVRSFVNSQGHMGLFQQELNVYGKEGQPCPHCGSAIRKIKVGGRGTHFCPTCQKRSLTPC